MNERLTHDENEALARAAGSLYAIANDGDVPDYAQRSAARALAAVDSVRGRDTAEILARLKAQREAEAEAEAGEQR